MKYTLALLLSVLCFASPRAALAQQLGGLAPFGRPAEANVPGDGLVLGVTTFESPTPQATGYFGESTASVPDVNDDGIDDLVIGAPGERVGPLDSAGRVYVFSGADGSLLLDLVSPIPTGVGNFGRAVAGLPDLDGDGAGDLLIGAFLDGADRNGRAYVFSGAEGTLIRTLQSPSPDPNGNGYFGFAVAGVPDVSGDGVPDLLVGAFLADSELGDDAGRVYLFDGATGALRLGIGAGEPEGHFGFSVAGVPDADGDGLGDFLVGAVSRSGGRGQVTLYSGATGDFRRRFFSPNSVLDGGFGGSVAGVPDLDGDGRGDLLVGAFSENGGADGAGRAYVFSGDDGSLIRALASPDPQENGGFGTVAAVLDVDLDGVPDVLVGAEAEGRAYVYSGATGALLSALMPPVPASGFGVAVAGVADLDGDGRGDLLVGSRFEDAGAEDAGRAYLFNGEGDGTNVPPLAIDDEAVTAERLTVFIPVYRNDVDANGDALFVESLGSPAGGSVKPDGDGILYTPNQGFIGIDSFTYTVSDGLGGSDEATVTVTVNQFPENVLPFAAPDPGSNDSFGIGVSSVPDVNADGIDDLLVGAADENGIETRGRAYLYSGSTGVLLRTLSSPDSQFGNGFGISVAGVSDVNGDGAGDLLVGAYLENDGVGRAYLFSGATGALLRTLESPSSEPSQFGWQVAAMPDTDGDAIEDLVVGSPGGMVYVFSGSTGLLLQTLESPDLESGLFGFAVAGFSDIDGDGRGDVIVGDAFGGLKDEGRAFIFSGTTGELLRTLQSPNPEENGSFFGFPVAGIADVSGDGLDDVLVGAFFEDSGAMNAGRAYVFDGATGDVLRTLTSPNPEEGGWFGIGLSNVPDADGDGQEDILVGAWSETGDGARGGRAHLFSGATGLLLRTLESPVDETGGLFGRTVAGVPDLDGDGLGELLVGARGEEGGAQNAGRAYLFLSGQGGTAPPVAGDDAATTTEGVAVLIDVLDNDSDPDGDMLTIAMVGEPMSGTAVLSGEDILYTPNTGFVGTDSFTYTISDNNDGTDEATVTVTVEGGSGGGFDVVPAEVAVTLNQGESRTVALTLTNTSARDATWSFPTCETARRAHGVEPAHRGIHQHVELAKGQRDPRPGHAPRFGAGGPDGFGYRWIDSNEPGGPTFDFVDISETGTVLVTISDTDDISEFVQLPFTFSFYGQDYDGVHVGTNGYLSFGQGFGTFSNDPIPSEETPNGFVAPFWDDLDPRTAEAAIYVQDLGDGRFVVQYDMIRDFPASSTEGTEKTFQVILYESNAILFQYADMGEGLTDATVGVENLDGTDGLEIAFDEVYVENGLAVMITSQPQWITAIDPPCGTLAPNTSTDVVVTLDAAGIAAGTYTHDLVLTTDVIGSEQRTIPFTFTVTEASIVVETQEETASANGVPVTVDVIGFTPTVAELRYRPTGTTEYATTALALNGTAYEGSVPAGAVTLRGVEYYVLLSDGERTVTYPADDPEANPARVRVRVAQEASAVALPANAEYRMVSIPLVLDDPSPLTVFGDDFGDYGPTSWRLLRHLPLAERYAEFPALNSEIVPGAGFWLAAYAEDTAPFDVENGLSVDASEPALLTLPPGWSQIGTPFAFPVAWADVLGSDLVQPPAAFDGAEYLLDQPLLDPWVGYFVLNDTEETITLTVPPTEVGQTVARGVTEGEEGDGAKSEEGYRLRLRADAQARGLHRGLRDTQNVLGFADGAAEGQDRRDLAEPPPITSHLRLSAVEDGVRLGHSFRPAGTDGAAWELELTASADVLAAGELSVRVALDEVGPRPDGYDVHVLDLDREVPLTLLEGGFEVSLRAERPVQRLRLIAGTDAYADAARGGISLVPVAFALAPAYPNPFAGSATLAYELPEPADVVLDVFDLLGRRVAVLAEGVHEAGRYTARWDGTVAGAPAANGVYVYRLRAGSFTASHKVVLLR